LKSSSSSNAQNLDLEPMGAEVHCRIS
jgi:hypothetical protein